MKLVHFSDLHLDSQFAWLTLSPGLARQRRQALRTTLLNIMEVARDEGADAILSGGDLFEHERVTPDTADFLQKTFASVAPIRVFLAPGNHDWYGPTSLYSQVAWSPNVHVFVEPRLRPVELAPGVLLWGAAHCAPANTDNFLDGFSANNKDMNLALFHGSERTWLSAQETGKVPHAPFDAADVRRAGLNFAFLGHFHTAKDTDTYTYPGNPDPLTFGEKGERGAVVAEVEPGATISLTRRRVATTTVSDIVLDVSGATNRQQIRDRLLTALANLEGFVRVTVSGELFPDLELHLGELSELAGPQAQVRLGRIHAGYDLESIRAERTIRGRFVEDVLASGDLSEDLRTRVLITGLRALDGRSDLEVS